MTCATEPVGVPTEAVLTAISVPLSCLVSAVTNVLDGTESERAEKTRRLFVEALDRICAEAAS